MTRITYFSEYSPFDSQAPPGHLLQAEGWEADTAGRRERTAGMSGIAVISDVHGNLEALEAVLACIDGLAVDAVYSLGDAVGYGPDPEACLRVTASRCRVFLENAIA